MAEARPAPVGRRDRDARRAGQRKAPRHDFRRARAVQGRSRSASPRLAKGAGTARRPRPAQGDCGSRPAGEYRRMMRFLLLACALALSACGLRPMYAGGESGVAATSLRSIQVSPIPGKAGWLTHKALVQRLGDPGGDAAFRLEVELDDNITGFGIRGDS